MAPGISLVHYGKYYDEKKYDNIHHGIKSKDSLHVSDCIKGNNLQGMQNFVNQLKESNYASNAREPLGKSIERNYKFPNEVSNKDFMGFGKKLDEGSKDFNKLIFYII